MRTRRYRHKKNRTRRHRSRKYRGGQLENTLDTNYIEYGGKTGKKWTTAIAAAQSTLQKTGSIKAAKKTLKKQALTNARKLFGSVGSL